MNEFQLRGMIQQNQIKHKLTNLEQVGKRIGISKCNMYDKCRQPDMFRLGEILHLFKVCKFTSRQQLELLGFDIEKLKKELAET